MNKYHNIIYTIIDNGGGNNVSPIGNVIDKQLLCWNGTTSKIDSCGKVATDILTPNQIEQDMLSRGFYKQGHTQVSGSLRYGFTSNTVVTEQDILGAPDNIVDSLQNHTIHLTRIDNAEKYMFVYKEDTLPDIIGFEFSGFLDNWQHVNIVVDGKNGKVYRSDNKTFATDVTFQTQI